MGSKHPTWRELRLRFGRGFDVRREALAGAEVGSTGERARILGVVERAEDSESEFEQDAGVGVFAGAPPNGGGETSSLLPGVRIRHVGGVGAGRGSLCFSFPLSIKVGEERGGGDSKLGAGEEARHVLSDRADQGDASTNVESDAGSRTEKSDITEVLRCDPEARATARSCTSSSSASM